jgi:hypothetical protein
MRDKVEFIDGCVVMGRYELVFSPEQAAAAARLGIRVRSCVDAVLADGLPGGDNGAPGPMSRDPFEQVMGARRGSNRGDSAGSDPPWWRWPPPQHERLSQWLDRSIAGGYIDLEVCADGHNNQYKLTASRGAARGGYAVLDVDAAAVLWLEDHWPDELVTARDGSRLYGWLRP